MAQEWQNIFMKYENVDQCHTENTYKMLDWKIKNSGLFAKI